MADPAEHFIVDIMVTGTMTPVLLDQQRAFLAELTAQGSLLVAAVIPEVKGRGIAIIRASSIDRVRDIYARAPVVVAGVATVEINLLRLTAGRILNAAPD